MSIQTLKRSLIRAQLFTATMAVFLLIVSFFVSDLIKTKKYIISRVESISNILTRNISVAINFDDKKEGDRVLNTINSEKEIFAVIAYDKNNNLFSSYGKYDQLSPGIIESISQDESMGGFLDYKYIQSNLILEAGEKIGKVVIVTDLLYYKKDFITSIILGTITFIIVIVLCFFTANINQLKISRPITHLTNTIQELTTSRDYSKRILIEDDGRTNIGEFHFLYDSFNDLLSAAQKRDHEIRSINENLESIVEAKTKLLEEEKAQSIQANKLAALGEMAGGIAHEINNPLTIISGTTRIVESLLKKDSFEKNIVLEKVADIKRTVDRISGIIKAMRSISHNVSDDERSLFTLKELISEVTSLCSVKMSDVGTTLSIDDNEHLLEQKISSNRVQLSQVFINLINNSNDAIEKNSEKWIKIIASKSGNAIVVRMVDSGKGISASTLEKLFRPFFTTKEIGRGTGLGLSLSRGIMKRLGGDLEYDEKNPNTCFVITIPNTV